MLLTNAKRRFLVDVSLTEPSHSHSVICEEKGSFQDETVWFCFFQRLHDNLCETQGQKKKHPKKLSVVLEILYGIR